MFVTFVKQSAVNGGYADNPFYFEHFDLSEIVLYVNGEPTPIRPMKLDFGENNNYVTPLCNLYQSSERWLKDESLVIDRDLGDGYINLVHQGHVVVYARFSKPTTATISAIAYCECPGLLLVDNTREVRQL